MHHIWISSWLRGLLGRCSRFSAPGRRAEGGVCNVKLELLHQGCGSETMTHGDPPPSVVVLDSAGGSASGLGKVGVHDRKPELLFVGSSLATITGCGCFGTVDGWFKDGLPWEVGAACGFAPCSATTTYGSVSCLCSTASHGLVSPSKGFWHLIDLTLLVRNFFHLNWAAELLCLKKIKQFIWATIWLDFFSLLAHVQWT